MRGREGAFPIVEREELGESGDAGGEVVQLGGGGVGVVRGDGEFLADEGFLYAALAGTALDLQVKVEGGEFLAGLG